jgi:NADH:ubiquinone oxidoreductase subunit 5 (subunit L)/multisubunit Na+/H+ antiporter MnhA subunit
MNIERLGGIFKKMPKTALLFLIAAIAICGLPPLNGFISEFLIFGGLYNWVFSANLISLIMIVFAIGGLVLIGGLALLCFTKAFSIVFLGTPRTTDTDDISERGFWQLLPMYLAAAVMITIGLLPSVFLDALQRPVNLFTHNTVFNLNLLKVGSIDSLKVINWLFFGFIIFVIIVITMRKYVTRKKIIKTGPTWGCGYRSAGHRFQYTANSFVRSYSKLAKPVLDIEKKDVEITEIFPAVKQYETDPYDKIERIFVDKPLKLLSRISDIFLFLQNGHLQRYILYGIVFITGVLGIPLIIEKIMTIIHFLNNL